jgi:hypothetical protein
MIADGQFDGVSGLCSDRETMRRIHGHTKPRKLGIEGLCFPKTVDELKPALEIANEFEIAHLNLQPNLRPRRLQDCIAVLEGWRRLADESRVPVFIETHRDRMTTDLFFMLDLLDCFPDLKLLGDLSHYLVAREFAWPVDEDNHRMIERVLDNCWAFHGRVASREQVQIEISFLRHKPWVELFLGWWEYGFASWCRRAGRDQVLTFTCELGPPPYSITGPEGNDTTERWAEAVQLMQMARALWEKVSAVTRLS